MTVVPDLVKLRKVSGSGMFESFFRLSTLCSYMFTSSSSLHTSFSGTSPGQPAFSATQIQTLYRKTIPGFSAAQIQTLYTHINESVSID